jgi:hypothetical protein
MHPSHFDFLRETQDASARALHLLEAEKMLDYERLRAENQRLQVWERSGCGRSAGVRQFSGWLQGAFVEICSCCAVEVGRDGGCDVEERAEGSEWKGEESNGADKRLRVSHSRQTGAETISALWGNTTF